MNEERPYKYAKDTTPSRKNNKNDWIVVMSLSMIIGGALLGFMIGLAVGVGICQP